MTPLMLACRLGRETMVGMLVDVFGAELDYADKVKKTTTTTHLGCQKTGYYYKHAENEKEVFKRQPENGLLYVRT